MVIVDGQRYYASEDKVYDLGKVTDGHKLRTLADDFQTRFNSVRAHALATNELAEVIYCELVDWSDGNVTHYSYSAFVRGNELILRTERLGWDKERLILVPKDRSSKEPTLTLWRNKSISAGTFDLARLTLDGESRNLSLQVFGHHTLIIDPQFLYEFGDRNQT